MKKLVVMACFFTALKAAEQPDKIIDRTGERDQNDLLPRALGSSGATEFPAELSPRTPTTQTSPLSPRFTQSRLNHSTSTLLAGQAQDPSNAQVVLTAEQIAAQARDAKIERENAEALKAIAAFMAQQAAKKEERQAGDSAC